MSQNMARHIVFVESSSSGAGERSLAYCSDRGYGVTLVTADPANAPAGIRVLPCDTADPHAVEAGVAELNETYPVHGVTTTHDLYVPQAALAAERLALPGLGYQAAAGVRNKYRMRCALERSHPRLNPAFELVVDPEEARLAAKRLGFPLIAKPQDGFDSWNVVRIDEPSQLDAYMRELLALRTSPAGLPLSPGVLLETFVAGPEHSVETAQARGGQLKLLAVTSKELTGEDDRHFAEIGIALPAPRETAALLFAEVSDALAALAVNCGVIHTECRIADGQVKIMEINPRLAGDMTGSHMIELACGASPIEQLVEIALGADPAWQPTCERAAAKYGLCVPRTGRFEAIANHDELIRQPGVATVRVAVRPGTSCRYPPRSNLDLVGRVVTEAETPELAMRIAKRVAAEAEVVVR